MPVEYDERYEVQNEDMKRQLRSIAGAIDAGLPEGMGFGLFLFEFGPGGAMFWLSNADRADIVASLKEWITKQEAR